MNYLRLAFAVVALLGYGALTFVALQQFGFVGLWAHGFKDVGSTQITVDLMLTSVFALAWLGLDARARGVSWQLAAPFVVWCVLGGGSSAFLAYLLLREVQLLRARPAEAATPPA